jgi:hypothetical protein
VIRRRFLTIILAARAAPAHTPVADREFLERVVDMERAWDLFYRRLAGCPDKGPADEMTCRPLRGRLDYAAFARSRRAAARLFDFRD